MNLIAILLGIIIQLITATLIAVVIALPLSVIIYFLCKKNKKQNSILAFLSPFVFIYTFYFIILIGGFICSAIFNTGCGMDGYYKTELPNSYSISSIDDDFDGEYLVGCISKNNKNVISSVTKVKVIGDSVYGTYLYPNETADTEHYFILDTNTNEIKTFLSYDQAITYSPGGFSDLYDLKNYYYDNWAWLLPLYIFAFLSASGTVLLLLILTNRLFRSLKYFINRFIH